MRKLVTAAATAFALTLGLAAPALADHSTYGNGNPGGTYGQDRQDDNYDRNGRRGDTYDGQRGRDGRYDFDRAERRLDNWERGWRHDNGWNNHRHHRTLSYHQLIRRLEYQGYYGVRGLRPARWGFGWRAFAYTGRGRPVMLRVNPYNGRVLDVRHLWG